LSKSLRFDLGHEVRLRRTHKARPNVPFGTGGDHKEHKEGEGSYLFIKYQFTSFAREKNTMNCLRQFEVYD